MNELLYVVLIAIGGGFLALITNKYPKLKSRIPTLWTRSYYCESIGHISEDTIKKYIEEQKAK